jgi:hypothetical protein
LIVSHSGAESRTSSSGGRTRTLGSSAPTLRRRTPVLRKHTLSSGRPTLNSGRQTRTSGRERRAPGFRPLDARLQRIASPPGSFPRITSVQRRGCFWRYASADPIWSRKSRTARPLACASVWLQ